MNIEGWDKMKDINLLIQNGIDVNKSLELFGNIEIYNETLVDFLKTGLQKITDLKHFKETSDLTNYSIQVHSLKSDSKYLGFTHLAELAYNHEMKSKDRDMMYVYNNFNELMAEVDIVVEVVKKYLGDTSDVPKFSTNIEKTNKKKILVVDDSNLVRTLLTRIFTDEFEVLTASDGNEALNQIAMNTDLYGVLLDLNMPNVNGFVVLEYFKQNNLFSKIPVAIITGDDTKGTVEKAFSYTIVDVLNKPFNERDIRRVVTSMINFH